MPNNSILNYFQKKSDPKQQTVRNLTKSEPLTPKIEKLNKKLAENKLASPKASSLKSSPKNDSDKENSPQKKKRRRVIESDSEEEEDTKKLVAPSNFESKSEAQKSPKKPKLEATSPAKIQPKKTPEAPKIKKLKESNSISKSPKAEVDSNFKPIDIKDYNPAADNFRFKKSICWQPQAPIPYAAFCRTLFHIGDTTKRTLKSNILCNHFKAILHHNDKHELAVALSMCVNSVAPDFTGIELNLGPMILSKAIGEATGSKPNTVKEQAQKKCNGDLGDYAELCKKKQKQSFMKPKLLFCQHVFKKLQDISKISGDGAQSRKAAVIKEILVSCSQPYEALFLIRSLSGKLRIQLQHATLLQALAEACFSHFSKMQKDTSLDVKDCETRIKTAYAEYPDLELLAHTIVEHGWEEVNDHIHLTPGVPTKPMLAHPTKSISEVLDRFKDVGDFTCEWKYDGERAQIHIQESEKKGKPPKISIYSRNQENHTEKYPDVVERMVEILKHADCKVKSCILDSEAVAYDTEKQQILPFQKLTTRKKKDVEMNEIKVQVCIYAFDLLYLNGTPLITQPFEERRAALRSSFPIIDGKFVMAQAKDCKDHQDIEEELDLSIKGGCEGLMVKTLNGKDSTYEIAVRSRNWLKVKKDYLEGVGDSLDLVPIGAWKGKGKRGGFFGAYLLACYDEDDGEYQAICKVGTGFKDTDLLEISERTKKYVIEGPKPYYQFSDMQKDIKDITWFDANEVWEIECADLTLSPVYKAAFGNAADGKGISLRFPRFMRLREDKKVEQATTSQQVMDMFFNQDQVKMQ